MSEKLYKYQGVAGRFHNVRDQFRERCMSWKEENPKGCWDWVKNKVSGKNENVDRQNVEEDYSHIFRRKSRRELVRLSAAVMGIEFSYAAETAFVSPTLLKIGVQHQHMTLVWALSPLIGFFLTPVLGSLSDRCHLRLGRRRPFILMLALGVLLGLILVPNGESIGYSMGDPEPPHLNPISKAPSAHRTSATRSNPLPQDIILNVSRTLGHKTLPVSQNDSLAQDPKTNQSTRFLLSTQNNTDAFQNEELVWYNNSHPWGVFFTVLGTVLLDFDADACQSPARAYLLDVTIPDDHARGLSTFTIMAGLGGFFGYAFGGINWDVTFLGELLGGHVRAVFTLTTLLFIVCVTYTVTCFREMPLHFLKATGNLDAAGMVNQGFDREENSTGMTSEKNYGSVEDVEQTTQKTPGHLRRKSMSPDPNASLLVYLQSIIYMPHSMRMLCLTNLLCWMAHVCYSLYFTDFVGEAVFKGNPTAPEGTAVREQYESGVRFGCWGMSMYSLSCACYSLVIEKLISKFGARKVYIGGILADSTGMLLMALTKNKVGVILFSWAAGVMYSTMFTMPYLIVAHYHAKGVFEVNQEGQGQISSQIRGLGTDVALVSSMVFLAQFILSLCMGTIVSVSGTTTAVVTVACILSFFGAISATRLMYLDL